MAVGYGVPCPKPDRGTKTKTRKRKRLRSERAFRNAVWTREEEKHGGEAYCQDCGIGPLVRTTHIFLRLSGHVAHDRGRNVAPADKYNPDAARLKCSRCHMGNDHGMRLL